jgi:hypothetical protein
MTFGFTLSYLLRKFPLGSITKLVRFQYMCLYIPLVNARGLHQFVIRIRQQVDSETKLIAETLM